MIKRYKKYVIPYMKYWIIGPLCMIVEVLGEVFLPFMLSKIINVGVAEKNIPYIIGCGLAMCLFALLMAGGGIGAAWFASNASMNFGADLRMDLYKKIQRFSFNNIDSFSTGSLVTRLTNDITQVQNMIVMLLRMCLRAPGMLIGATIMAFMMNPQLALVIVVVIPILAGAIGFIMATAFPRFGIMQQKLDKLNSCIQESIVNIRVIKSFVRNDFEEEKFKTMNHDLRDTTLSAMKVVIFNMPVLMLIMNATTIAVVWFGGNMIIGGTGMLIGDLTAFINYVTQILMSLMMMSFIFLNFSRVIASVKRINEVLDTEIDLTDDTAQRPDAQVTAGKVEFKNVAFRYYKNNEKYVLNNINFEIEAGKILGIIGSTGCGKTTLVSMIPRLYDVDEGEVLVDGINVKDYSLYNLREGVGMVLQKNVLFSGDIMENLRWGNAEASEEEVMEFAKSAQAHNFVMSFPDKYKTQLGQGGSNVSGGQKQRLCIARALLKKPKILILDDSTSAVDTATEAKIRQAFHTSLKDTTKIIIAQRITSVMDADKIIVMDEGVITGIGTHDELMNTCETYREIYESQTNKEVNA